MARSFILTDSRVCAGEPRTCMLTGYFSDNSINDTKFRAYIGGRQRPVRVTMLEGPAVYRKYASAVQEGQYIDREYVLWIQLPQRKLCRGKLEVYACRKEEKSLVFQRRLAQMGSGRPVFRSNLEICEEDAGKVHIEGWAAGEETCDVEVCSPDGSVLPAELTRKCREDVASFLPELYQNKEAVEDQIRFGIELTFPLPAEGWAQICISCGGQQDLYRVRKKEKGVAAERQTDLRSNLKRFDRDDLMRFLRHRLERRRAEKAAQKTMPESVQADTQKTAQADTQKAMQTGAQKTLQGNNQKVLLEAQTQKTMPETAQQSAKNGRGDGTAGFPCEPLISIVVPLYRTDKKWLAALVDSVRAQTYSKWELCLSDGSGADSPLTDFLEKLTEQDPRIRVTASKEPLGISANTNAALLIAKGDYIAFADHDDLLDARALYECVRAMNAGEWPDMVFTDEDKITMDGSEYFFPNFKPDFNPDMLRSTNYFCHLVMVKKQILDEAGYLDDGYDGAQDYDLVLRCVEKSKNICHVPKVLYHWRAHKDSTAENPESKRYAFEAGRRAVAAHLARLGVSAEVKTTKWLGMYHVHYALPEKKPSLSVILYGTPEDAQGSRRLLRENGIGEEAQILALPGPLTAMAANRAVEDAKNDCILFLDARLAPTDAGSIREMLGYACREEIGAVGGLQNFQGGNVCQAGIILDRDARVWRAFEGAIPEDPGYFARIRCVSDLSAVPVSCMMVRRETFRAMGGFDEDFPEHYFDVDFCLRLRTMGKWAVYVPFAEFAGGMPVIRKYELTDAFRSGYLRERALFRKRYRKLLEQGDPNYNPQFAGPAVQFEIGQYREEA